MGVEGGIDLTGKVAVITGAGRGIGAAIVGAFAEAGADIVVADLNHESAQQSANRVKGQHEPKISNDFTAPPFVPSI